MRNIDITFDDSNIGSEERRLIEKSAGKWYEGYKYSFNPSAIYHKELDVIRVVVEDRPWVEYRFTADLTVFVPASLDGRDEIFSDLLNAPVGFALKGVGASESINTAQQLADRLNSLAQQEGNQFVKNYIIGLLPMTKKVTFSEHPLASH